MTPSTPARREAAATYQDVLDAPENVTAEIVGGELVLTPRPAHPHQAVTTGLGVLVGGPYQFGIGGPGGWILLVDPEIEFGEDLLVPDVAGWRAERGLAFPRTGSLPHVPDWVCEVLSPSTAARDRTSKSDIYLASGVEHMWLVDPLERVLEIFAADDGGWRRLAGHHGDLKVRAAPFDAIELDLALLWPRYEEPEAAPGG